MSNKIFSIFTLSLVSTIGLALGQNCQEFVSEYKTDANFHQALSNDKAKSKALTGDLDCLDTLIRVNFFSTAKYLLDEQFGSKETHGSETGKGLSKAQSGV